MKTELSVAYVTQDAADTPYDVHISFELCPAYSPEMVNTLYQRSTLQWSLVMMDLQIFFEKSKYFEALDISRRCRVPCNFPRLIRLWPGMCGVDL